MKLLRNPLLKVISVFLALNILMQAIAVPAAYALTAGPNAPEFSSFEPIATTDMVDMFGGEFVYNLPVLDVPGAEGGGYSLSLSHHSGTSSEEEASWVGFGWTLNPGSIVRNTNGIPDDYSATIDHYNKVRPNWSATRTTSVGGIEAFSQDIPISLSKAVRVNNHQGFARTMGITLDFKGYGNLGMNFGAEGVTFSAEVNPAKALSKYKDKLVKALNSKLAKKDKEPKAVKAPSKFSKMAKKVLNGLKPSYNNVSMFGSEYGLFSFSESYTPSSVNKSYGIAFSFKSQIDLTPSPTPVGTTFGSSGSFNMQHNKKKNSFYAIGFMNSPNSGTFSSDEANVISDYHVERNNPYNKRDFYLGVPFADADNFVVSGEGLGGGFRMYPNRTGHFYPNTVESNTFIAQLGIDLTAGLDPGIGLNFGVGNQRLKCSNWKFQGNTNNFQYGDGGFFRFNNDMGGKVEYHNHTGVTYADVVLRNKMIGARNAEPALPDDGSLFYYANNGGAKGSSSHIAYQTNWNGINNFAVTNEDGNQYVYGQPVYTRNESSLQFDVEDSDADADGYLAYKNIYMNSNYDPDLTQNKRITGEVKRNWYASTYLLTQLLTPDYVDVNANGSCDAQDFGGWTKFDYHQTYGSSSSAWYRYRTPYNGLLYQQNSISDKKDDAGVLNTGEKEVYYLKTIETKTHIACFVTNKSTPTRFPDHGDIPAVFLTGSQNDRPDGLAAAGFNSTSDIAASSRSAKGNEQVEYLEKIVLFSKDRLDVPIKTVKFAYDWSLVQNLPNNIYSNYPGNVVAPNTGKLTLKKVWFEYEGTVPAMISPYEFVYKYKDESEFPAYLRNEYAGTDILSYGNHLSDQAQNPNYAPHLLDVWGNNQVYGRERQKDDIPWLYQGPIPASEAFDPAAWQLKQIKLPSGGEILIQYEQKDYSSVQDREVMAMARLKQYDEGLLAYKHEPVYTIDVRDLGVDPANLTEVTNLKYAIDNYFTSGTNERLYYKFLYSLILGADPSLNNCKSEYISGYANFKSSSINSSIVSGEYHIDIELDGSVTGQGGNDRPNVPRQACYEFAATQRQGKLIDGECMTMYERVFDPLVQSVSDLHDQPGVVRGLAKFGLASTVIATIKTDPTLAFQGLMTPKQVVGTKINKRHSFIKLPMIKAKRGGGVRVKRLLMYDPGIETQDAAIYGSEYSYKNEDGTSSGVAANEPSEAREENPIISFLPRKQQTWFSRLTAGEDKEQAEGPIGESILPGASVGHSRIVVKNIHSGKTDVGFSVHEFFTAKDYPFDKHYTDVDGAGPREFDVLGSGVDFSAISDNKKQDFMIIPAGLFNFSTKKFFAGQGFRFILNNMHGQPKRVSSYGGAPDGVHYLTTMTEYSYYEPGEKIKMLRADGTYELDNPGKEMDIAMEMKEIKDVTCDFSLEVDLALGLMFFPPIWPTLFPSFSYADNRMSTHTTSKVSRYPTVLKSVLTFQEGVYSMTENLAFNPHTGKPVLTRTTDGFDKVQLGDNGPVLDGSVYSLTIPAAWKYPQMGQKAIDPANTNQLNEATGNFTTYGANGNPLRGRYVPGNPPTTPWNLQGIDVISASVQTYSNSGIRSSWLDAIIESEYDNPSTPSNDIVASRNALDRVWRPNGSYVYKADVKSSNDPSTSEDKIYKGGIFKNFTMFDWSAELAGQNQTDSRWLRMNEVTKYSPNGQALEEKNILNIYSAAKYGYNHTLPVILSKNSKYESIQFEDFESREVTSLNNFVTGIAHSGSQSFHFNKSGEASGILLSGLASTSQLTQQGGYFKFWLKSEFPSSGIYSDEIPVAEIGSVKVKCEKVAKTGEWTLYTAKFDPSVFTVPGTAFSVNVYYNSTGGESVYIDDARFQPLDAQAVCYVYDVKSRRLIVQFDDQHFGLYYQYDGEGKLVRKMVETEKGLKTIQETQYNTPDKLR